MTRLIAIAIVSLTCSAFAGGFYVVVDSGTAPWLDGHFIAQSSVELFNGDPAIPGELARSRQPFDLDGMKWNGAAIVPMTAQEIAAQEAERAAAQEEAALYADPEPSVFAPRVDSTLTNVVGESQIFVDAGTGELFAVDETGSPEHTLAQKQAQAAARETKKALVKSKKNAAVKDRLDALEAYLGIK